MKVIIRVDNKSETHEWSFAELKEFLRRQEANDEHVNVEVEVNKVSYERDKTED